MDLNQKNKQLQIGKEFCEDTAALKEGIEGGFLRLGQNLLRIREERLWEPHWESFEEYTQETMNMKKTKANKLINIFKKFVIDYKIPRTRLVTIGQDSLQEILPAVKDEDSAKEWVQKAEDLKHRNDLRKEVKELRTGVLMVECQHEDTYTIKICRGCGDRWQEH